MAWKQVLLRLDGFESVTLLMMDRGRWAWRLGVAGCTAVALMASVFGGSAAAQMAASVSVNPVALVRRAVQLRLEEEKSHRPVRYVLRKTDGDHETTKEIVETKDGDVARLIAINGQPLTAEQEQAEINRLDTLAAHPEMQERRRRSEQRDAARIDQLVGMLPDSEVYKLEGMVSCGASQCYRLSFAPNPNFETPNLEADVLRGFAGEVWIEETQQRLVRLDAHLVREVTIGFGILGRLNEGGTMQLQQEFEGNAQEWQPTVLKMNLSGKALMVKTVNIKINELASDFSPVPPDLGYRDAIALLKKPGTFGAQQ
jgi:hypothetical protein